MNDPMEEIRAAYSNLSQHPVKDLYWPKTNRLFREAGEPMKIEDLLHIALKTCGETGLPSAALSRIQNYVRDNLSFILYLIKNPKKKEESSSQQPATEKNQETYELTISPPSGHDVTLKFNDIEKALSVFKQFEETKRVFDNNTWISIDQYDNDYKFVGTVFDTCMDTEDDECSDY